MEINQKLFVYPVGKFYDVNQEKIPNPESKYDHIIYLNPKLEEWRVISSIEGYFVSTRDLSSFFETKGKNILFKGDSVNWLEKNLSGKIYFNKK